MYLYFDKTGVLKEVINDRALRQSDSNDYIYIYVEDLVITTISSLTFQYKNSEELLPVVPNVYQVVSGVKVPYSNRRDLKYFNYFDSYNFIKIPTSFTYQDEPYSALAVPGNVSLTVRINNEALGLIVFNVEETTDGNHINPDQYLTLAQFYYLLNYLEEGIDGIIPVIDATANDMNINALIAMFGGRKTAFVKIRITGTIYNYLMSYKLVDSGYPYYYDIYGINLDSNRVINAKNVAGTNSKDILTNSDDYYYSYNIFYIESPAYLSDIIDQSGEGLTRLFTYQNYYGSIAISSSIYTITMFNPQEKILYKTSGSYSALQGIAIGNFLGSEQYRDYLFTQTGQTFNDSNTLSNLPTGNYIFRYSGSYNAGYYLARLSFWGGQFYDFQFISLDDGKYYRRQGVSNLNLGTIFANNSSYKHTYMDLESNQEITGPKIFNSITLLEGYIGTAPYGFSFATNQESLMIDNNYGDYVLFDQSDLIIDFATTFEDKVDFQDEVVMNDKLAVKADMSVTGSVSINGDLVVNTDVDVFGNANFEGDITTAGITADGNIVPNVNSDYSLGSQTKQWEFLYVYDAIYLGGNTIYADNGDLHVVYNNVDEYLVTESYLNSIIANIKRDSYIAVNTTTYPTLNDFLASSGEEGYMYLYPIDTSDLTKGYYRYIWENDSWLALGTTEIDLSGYMTLATNQTITGIKTFEGDLKFKGNGTTTIGQITTVNYAVKIGFGGINHVTIGGSSFYTNVADYDLGSSSNKWRDAYVSRYLTDGTNSITVANIVSKTFTIAGVDMQDNITAQELTDSLVFMNNTTDIDYVMGD